MARLRSIDTKLGVLVASTVAVAMSLALTGTSLGASPWIVVPAAVVAALGLTPLLARGITAPLRQMMAVTQAMSAGDYSQRVHATAHDEVGELARAFNAMAADHEAVDRQRRDLVATVTDELHTPVAGLRALVENLLAGVVRPDPDTLAVALAHSERLRQLLAGLLDLSRLDAGDARLNPELMAVRPFLQEAVREARLAGHPVRYQVAIDPFDLVVDADRARLHQLLANLLDNAGRHSPPDGTVKVRAYRGLGRMVLEVEDEGPAIPADEQPLAFERFAAGGTGVGLSIARWVTDLHGGTIEVVDRPHGLLVRARIPNRDQPTGAVVDPAHLATP